MTNFIDLNILNFFISISNKGFHILDSIMIFFTVLGDDWSDPLLTDTELRQFNNF